MDDRTLDRELEALFAVDPAADFTARVRQRIAAEPAPGWRPSTWGLVTSAALATAALLLVVFRINTVAPTTVLPARPVEMVAHTGPTAIAPAPPVEKAPARTATVSVARVDPFTDVVVDPAEVAAWDRLLRRPRSHRVEIAGTAQTLDESMQPLPDSLVLPPVIIEPLTTDVGEQGVHP